MAHWVSGDLASVPDAIVIMIKFQLMTIVSLSIFIFPLEMRGAIGGV